MTSFVEACGVREPLALELEGPDGSAAGRWSFVQPSILIGSHPRADLRLDHPDVGTRHLWLQAIGGRFAAIELESLAGLTAMTEDEAAHWLNPGWTCEVGPYRLRLLADGAANGTGSPSTALAVPTPAERNDPNPLTAVYAGAKPVPPVILRIGEVGKEKPSSYQLNRVLTLIGRTPVCKIKFKSDGEPKFFCALLRTPDGLWVVDLLGSDHVTMNGNRFRTAQLGAGDELRILSHSLSIRPDIPSVGSLAHAGTHLADQMNPITYHAGLAPGSSTDASLTTYNVDGPEIPTRVLLSHMVQMQQQMCDQFQQAMLMMSQLFGTMHRDQMQIIREELEQIRTLTRDIRSLQQAQQAGTAAKTGLDAPRGAAPAPGRTNSVPPRPTVPDSRVRHDPETIHALVSERLAIFEAERQSRWNKILGILGKGR